MRRRVIAGNWKMYKRSRTLARFSPHSCRSLPARSTATSWSPPRSLQYLPRSRPRRASSIAIAGQKRLLEQGRCLHRRSFRPMLAEAGLPLRHHRPLRARQLFARRMTMLPKKSLMALESGLTPIVCLGETQEDRMLALLHSSQPAIQRPAPAR